MSDIINFYNQGEKTRSWNFEIGTETGYDDEEGSGNYIYMNEGLTPTNRKLLKDAMQRLKDKDCSFKGYTINGQVRVKKITASEPILMRVWKILVRLFDKFFFSLSFLKYSRS